MSRSIHTTRKHLEERRKKRDQNPEARRDEIKYLKQELRKKRLIKALVYEERHTQHPEAPLPPEAVTVSIKDTGEHLHYPASPEDVRGILRRLPAGYLNGLSSITLCVGVHAQPPDDDGEPDPIIGRVGEEIFPGVYCARTIGTFYDDPARIELFAYVYQNDVPLRAIKETYLRLLMLSTLAHELAHHYDFRQRVARGKWRSENGDKAEIYAEEIEHQWAKQYVLPYMLATYPEEVQALLSWIEAHGGVALALPILLPDPRVTREDGLVLVDSYNVRGAVSLLMEDVEDGETPPATFIDFARDLHYEGHYDLARQCLAKALETDPEDSNALTLIADIDVHEERYEHAEGLCQQILARDPKHLEAWEVSADVCVGLGKWSELIHSTTSALALKPAGYGYLRALRLQGRALLRLERYEEVAELIKLLPPLNGKLGPSTAWELTAKMLLQQGKYEEALAFSIEHLSECATPSRPILEAARLDAAYQLGRPYEAEALSAFSLKRLRDLGFTDWADVLVSYSEA